MKADSTDSVFLLDVSEKLVCIERVRYPKDSHQLVVQDGQPNFLGNANKVTVYNIKHGLSECMAFGFEVKKKKVFPVVTDDQQVCFKVLDAKDISFDETFLFQWGEPPSAGQWRTLKSVAEPKKYLHVEEKSGKVSIAEQRDSFFSFSQKKKANAANRNSNVDIYGSGKIQENEKISWRRRSLKRRPSCCEGSVTSHNPLRCSDRKTKRMKMSLKS